MRRQGTVTPNRAPISLSSRLIPSSASSRSLSKLEAEVEEARALAAHPALLRVRELQALGDMARAGGKFVVGLKADGAGHGLLRDD